MGLPLIVLVCAGGQVARSLERTAESPAPIVKIEGRTTQPYKDDDVKDGTVFDLTRWLSNGVGRGIKLAFDIGNQDAPPREVHVTGGVIEGHIPLEWDWRTTHSFGGGAYRTTSSGLQVLEWARVHNVEDCWQPRETPEYQIRAYSNTGRILMRHVYMTGIRDDCIENDEFIPGDIEDSLFDGVWTFLSEQNERNHGVLNPNANTIGPDEDTIIRVTRVLVRLYPTNGEETGAGKWFKWMGRGARNHSLVITDSVFAVDQKPRQGWKNLDIPKQTSWKGSNAILWLGTPGEYGGPKPAGVAFLEGQAAKAKWNQVRTDWLKAHGYEPRPADDWNSMDDPVVAPLAGREGGARRAGLRSTPAEKM